VGVGQVSALGVVLSTLKKSLSEIELAATLVKVPTRIPAHAELTTLSFTLLSLPVVLLSGFVSAQKSLSTLTICQTGRQRLVQDDIMGNRAGGILVDDTDEGWRAGENAVVAAVHSEIVDINIRCVLH
jgi:hypothetical protein